ncbi:glycosyltransferase family 9 protein [Fusobacterium gastrosuis]|uniref:glycosyltransferase family 9 protein n=1 Tax=Fusobacterium gastrosuis TaxID=1755100 RepID=UPI002970C135|nr:glycosyltransferase family 9 protein [Fusobacteriaceae bacterium]MDY5713578.1 glycosyltransferase family 9 protein [Fusobacterium gastrosuis]
MNILIIHTAFIGDIVLSTALIAKLKDKYPDSNIFFLTTPLGKAVLANNPRIKEIICYDKHGNDKGFSAFIKLTFSLRAKKIDLCLCPHRYFRSSILSFFSGAKIKIGYDVASLSFLFTEKIKYDKTKHEVEKLLSFVDKSEKRYELEMYPDQNNINNIKKFIGKTNKKIITIAPGSKWFTKKWPEEYFKTLIKNLSEVEDFLIVISGGEEEKEINLELSPKVIDLRGKISLLDLAALCKISDLVISNDSAPIHIASAFPKTKIFGIFGPTVKEFGFFPWSKNSTVFEVNNLYCRPCGIHGGNSCPEKHFRCMREILPESLEREIKNYLYSK